MARWLGWMLLLNLAWEIVQMPLYALPPAPFPFYTAYSIIHCTAGDVLIGAAIYAVASFTTGWRWLTDAPLRGLAVLLPLGLGYTAYSEWRNVYVVGSWGYGAPMPMLFGIGAAPLAQWLVVPPLAAWLSRK
ncbi:MAG: hypothetical protein ACM3PU_08920 [Gemmatimonadota bacterium]